MAKIGCYPATDRQVEIYHDVKTAHDIFETIVW